MILSYFSIYRLSVEFWMNNKTFLIKGSRMFYYSKSQKESVHNHIWILISDHSSRHLNFQSDYFMINVTDSWNRADLNCCIAAINYAWRSTVNPDAVTSQHNPFGCSHYNVKITNVFTNNFIKIPFAPIDIDNIYIEGQK